ncbi:MAG: hypothetical protein AAF065_04075 [Verrucomicrobiota bacterium]
MKTAQLKYLQIATLGLIAILAGALKAEEHEEHHGHEEREHLHEEISAFLKEDPEGVELMRFVKTNFPSEIPAFVEAAIKREPEMAREVVEQLAEVREDYLFFTEEAPEEAQLFLNIQKHELLSMVLSRSFDPEAKHAKEIEVKIRNEVEAAFDLKMEMEKNQIRYLETEIQELNQLLQEREALRGQIIQRRIDALTGANEHLEW